MQSEDPIPLATASSMQCTACKKSFALQAIPPFSKVFCSACGSEQMAAGQLGSYQVLNLLGRGGMGAVYRGIDPALDRTVAIKVLAANFAAGPGALEQFRREAKAAAQISHINVASIFAYGIEQQQPYIVMEFVSGRSLMAHIDDRGPLDVPFVLHIAIQAAEGLAAAATHNLVHGDVKPENILVDTNDTAKIIDFGLASLANKPGSREIWGTPYYISPERLTPGTQIDFRSDLYSLGGSLYHAVTGTPPFDGASAVEIAKARLKTTPTPPSVRRPSVDPDVSHIIMRALQREPSGRYPSYDSMIGDMRRASTRLGAYSRQRKRSGLLMSARQTSSVVVPRTESRKPSALMPVILAGIALLGIVGSALYFLNRPPPPPYRAPAGKAPVNSVESVARTPTNNLNPPEANPPPSLTRPAKTVPVQSSNVLLFALRDEVTTEPNTSVLVDVLANDTHPGGVAPELAGVTDPLHGRVAITSNNRLSYTPNPDYEGTDTFNYTIRHSSGKTANSAVTVTVAKKKTPPPPSKAVETAAARSPVPVVQAPAASNDMHAATGEAPVVAASAPEWTSDPTRVRFSPEELTTYAPAKRGATKGSHVILDNGRRIRLMGQSWEALPIRYLVTSNTVLECIFSATREGGVHAIGLDDQRKVMNEQRLFQLYGTTQSGANRDYMNYGRFAPGNRGYRIPIGRFYTGQFSYLVVGSSAGTLEGDSIFYDVLIHEVTNSPAPAAIKPNVQQ